MFLTEDKVLMG